MCGKYRNLGVMKTEYPFSTTTTYNCNSTRPISGYDIAATRKHANIQTSTKRWIRKDMPWIIIPDERAMRGGGGGNNACL